MDEEWQVASALPTHCEDNSDATKPAAPIMSRCPAMEQEWQQLLLERLSVDVQGDSVAPAGDLNSCSELTHCSAPAAPSSPLFAGKTSIDGDEPTAEDFAEFRSFMSSKAREKRTSLASEQAADSEPAAAGDENAGSAEKAVSSSTVGGVDNVLVALAGTASGSARETLQYLLAPADASAAEPSARVLFGEKDLQRLQKQRLNPEFLHEQARSALNANIRNFQENNSAQAEYHPVTTQEWPTWR